LPVVVGLHCVGGLFYDSQRRPMPQRLNVILQDIIRFLFISQRQNQFSY